ncbi:MAG: hypothetical protein PVJ49_09840 [Acidobacteriota bacterium]|jgi:hypothetical protein
MSRSTTTCTTRALGLLAAVFACTTLLVAPAAAQSLDAAQPRSAAPQQQTPPAETGGVDWVSGWSWGGRGAVTLLSEDSLETGFGVSGFAVLPLTTDFEIEGEIGYQTMSTVTDGLPAGRLSMFPLRATLRVQLWRIGGAKPYAGAGAGVYLSRFSIDQSVLDELATVGFAASANVDPGLAFHVGGGIEWQRGRVNFGVDVKYLFGSTDATSTVVDQVTEQVFRETASLGFDGFWIAAGARFSF